MSILDTCDLANELDDLDQIRRDLATSVNRTLTDRERLSRDLASVNLYLRTYSPGDGITRYRFFRLADDGSQPNSYFGPGNGIATVLGFKAARAWVDSFRTGFWIGREEK